MRHRLCSGSPDALAYAVCFSAQSSVCCTAKLPVRAGCNLSPFSPGTEPHGRRPLVHVWSYSGKAALLPSTRLQYNWNMSSSGQYTMCTPNSPQSATGILAKTEASIWRFALVKGRSWCGCAFSLYRMLCFIEMFELSSLSRHTALCFPVLCLFSSSR